LLRNAATAKRQRAVRTTEANAIVAPIHPKAMPVILTTPAEFDQWLLDADALGALALPRPLPGDPLWRVAKGEKEEGSEAAVRSAFPFIRRLRGNRLCRSGPLAFNRKST
jgi:putative SOS response-associated peptidase YedK